MSDAPQRIGPYEISGELGRGAMGVVYRATRPDLDRPVAVKLLRLERTPDERDLVRFRAEGRAAARLRHPNIVALHEVGECELGPYLVLELIEGETVFDRLEREGRIDSKETARLASQIARALAHAHDLGILHRDVKPANVLVEPSGRPLLTDFGLAKDLARDERLTETSATMGTPAYMSPEQARGDTLDPRTDVWSLGALVYELLTGKAPFERSTPYRTLQAIVNEDPRRPRELVPGVARDLEVVCLRCLEKETGDRYASAVELALDLERFLRGEPVAARSPGVVERGARALRRNLGVGLVVAAITFVVACVTWATWRSHHAAQRRAREDAGLARDMLGLLVADVRDGLEDVEGARVRALRRDLLEKALASVERLGELEDERGPLSVPAAEAHRQIAEIALTAGDSGRALAEYGRSVDVLRKLADDELALGLLVAVLVERGRVELLRGDLLTARKTLDEALERARKRVEAAPTTAAQATLARTLSGLAAVQRARGELEAAGSSLAEALALARELGASGGPRDRRELASALLAASAVARERGELRVALADAREALELARLLSSREPRSASLRRLVTSALVAVGGARFELGEPAVREREEALGIAREFAARDPEDAAAREDLRDVLVELGVAALGRHDPTRALELFEESLALARALRSQDLDNVAAVHALAGVLERLGQTRESLGDLEGARAALEEGLALEESRREAASQSAAARCLGRLGGVQELSGDVAAALAAYERAVSLERQLAAADPSNALVRLELMVTLGLWGELLEDEHDRAGARRHYEETLEIGRELLDRDPGNARARANRAAGNVRLALLLDGEGDEVAALSFVERASDDQGQVASRARADVDRLEWLTKTVRPEFSKTRDLLSSQVTPATATDEALIGKALLRRGDPVAALPHLERALEARPPQSEPLLAACAAAQALARVPESERPALASRALAWLEATVHEARDELAKVDSRLAAAKASPERASLAEERRALVRRLDDVRSREPALEPLRAMTGFQKIASDATPPPAGVTR